MRDSITLLEHVNVYQQFTRQRLLTNQSKHALPHYSTSRHLIDNELQLKNLSCNVYTSQHLMPSRASVVPATSCRHCNQFILPSIDKHVHRDRNLVQTRPRRLSYRQSLYHSELSKILPEDLGDLTTRGIRKELRITIPMAKSDDIDENCRQQCAPPPSPVDVHVRSSSRSSSQQSPVDNVPYRLPARSRAHRVQCVSTSKTPVDKTIRSTLSTYLEKYY
jgi:hypothetical protein